MKTLLIVGILGVAAYFYIKKNPNILKGLNTGQASNLNECSSENFFSALDEWTAGRMSDEVFFALERKCGQSFQTGITGQPQTIVPTPGAIMPVKKTPVQYPYLYGAPSPFHQGKDGVCPDTSGLFNANCPGGNQSMKVVLDKYGCVVGFTCVNDPRYNKCLPGEKCA